MTSAADLPSLVERVRRLLRTKPADRVLIGITGAPGSGKSTLAEALVSGLAGLEADAGGEVPSRRWIGSIVAHVPMDGFHLADLELARLGRADRKGAPDTFDPGGYVALLRRLRTAADTVWAPGFDREIEQPVAGAIPVLPGVRVVVTEGNYLLLDTPGWADVRGLLDEVWFCDPDRALRVARLTTRHERFGKTAEQATRWATGPDEDNAVLINATRPRADLVLTSGSGL